MKLHVLMVVLLAVTGLFGYRYGLSGNKGPKTYVSNFENVLGTSFEMKVTSSRLGELKFRRILIPLSGDFAGSEKTSNMNLFIGDAKYFPEPIINKTGYSVLLKLIAELEKAKK